MPKESLHSDRRRSSRMARDMQIEVSGTDAKGKTFVSSAKTILLSQYGAKILLEQQLAPEQEISVSCGGIMTGEAARVVKLLRQEAAGYTYGIEFLRTADDFWKTQFPPD